MKTVSVTEFRGNIKKYLDEAENEKIIIHRSKGQSFLITPLKNSNENYLLSPAQKVAIEVALKDIETKNVFSHKEAMEKIKAKHPKYFK